MTTPNNSIPTVYFIAKSEDFDNSNFINGLQKELEDKSCADVIHYKKSPNNSQTDKKYEENFNKADLIGVFFSKNWVNDPKKSDIFKEVSYIYTNEKAFSLLNDNRVFWVSLDDVNQEDILKYSLSENNNEAFNKDLHENFTKTFKYSHANLDLIRPRERNESIKIYLNFIIEKGKVHKIESLKIDSQDSEKTQLEIKSIMPQSYKTFSEDNYVYEILQEEKFRHFPVFKEKNLVRLISQRDIYRGIPSEEVVNHEECKEKDDIWNIINSSTERKLNELGTEVTGNEYFHTVKENTPIYEVIGKFANKLEYYNKAKGKLESKRFSCFPVYDEHNINVSIITYIDILKNSKLILGKDFDIFSKQTLGELLKELEKSKSIIDIDKFSTIGLAYSKIEHSNVRTLFVKEITDNRKKYTGILSDEDIKRNYINGKTDKVPVSVIMNDLNNFLKFNHNDTVEHFILKFTNIVGVNNEAIESKKMKDEKLKSFTTFPVFDETNEFLGLIGYVDIFRKIIKLLNPILK